VMLSGFPPGCFLRKPDDLLGVPSCFCNIGWSLKESLAVPGHPVDTTSQ
jgi:hypothetical protein